MPNPKVPPPADLPYDRSPTSTPAAVVVVPLGVDAATRASVWAAILIAVHRAGLLTDDALYEATSALIAGTRDIGVVARRALAHVESALGLTVVGRLAESVRSAILADLRDVRGVAIRFDKPVPADTALERALSAGNLTQADGVALREHPFTTGVGGLLTRLRPSDLVGYPLLALRAGVAMYAKDQTRAGADSYFAVAVSSHARLEEVKDPVQRAVAQSLMGMAHRRMGVNDAMVDLTYRALAVLEPLALGRRATGVEAESIALGLDQAGISLYVAGECRDARRTFEALAVHAAAGAMPHRINRAHALLALLDAVEGRMDSAERRLARIDPVAWPGGWDGHYLAKPAHIARASLLASRADPRGALEELRLADQQYPTADFWGAMHVTRLVAAGLAGDDELMAGFLREAEEHPGPRLPRTVASIDLGHAIAGGLAPHVAPPRPPYTALSDSARAISALVLVRSRPAAAAEVVAGITVGVPLVRIFVVMTRFLAASEQDRPAAAAEVAALANRHGLWWPFAMLTASERELLREVAPPGTLAEVDRYRARASSSRADVMLTEGEQRVLTALATGVSRPQMARDLHLSLNTVKSHLRTLYLKLGAATRDQALQRAHSLGLLQPMS